jgi:DNA-directed RNA polymerase subunit RPC12/RpoP
LELTINKCRDQHVKLSYECKQCLKITSVESELLNHWWLKHKGVITSSCVYVVDIELFVFFSSSLDVDLTLPTIFELNIQMFSADGTEMTNGSDSKNVAFYKCKQCKIAVFINYHQFKLHVRVFHELKRSYQIYPCIKCNATFSSKSRLEYHTQKNEHLSK